MRPGALSRLGFLGKDESLLEILAEDNRFVVEAKGLTHQELARHLHIVGAVAVKYGQQEAFEFLYHGKRFKAKAVVAKWTQPSPFRDDTKSGTNITLRNLDNGQNVVYALLVVDMIERYGFYEGKGTPYRVPPTDIAAVLDFLKKTP